MTETERRAFRRIPLRMEVESVEPAEDRWCGSGITQDVSAGGMLMDMEQQSAVRAGQMLDFVILYEGVGTARPGLGRIFGRGQIVRVDSGCKGRMRVAVAFSDRLSISF